MNHYPDGYNVGLGMVPGYMTREEKEIERLTKRIKELERELSARPEEGLGLGFVQSGSDKPAHVEVAMRKGPPLPEDFGCSHHSWKQIYGPPEYIANYHEAAAQYWRNMNLEQ